MQDIKRYIPPQEGNGLRLRLLEERDLATTLAWRNEESARKWFNFSGIITPEMHHQWWSAYRGSDKDFVFLIELPQGQAAGQVAVYDIHWPDRSAEYGRCLVGPQALGQNVLFRASQVLFEIARSTLGLARLYLQVKRDNAKAKHIYDKLGFSVTRVENGLVFMDKVFDTSDERARPI